VTDTPSNSRAQSRLVRIFLRDHRVLEAMIFLPDMKALALNLGMRGWINLTQVRWLGTGETLPHLVLAAERILWATLLGETPAAAPGKQPASPPRRVEITSETGVLLHGNLGLAPQQRVSDYLSTASQFITLRQGRLVPQGHALGEIVVNQKAILSVREATAEEVAREERGEQQAAAPAPAQETASPRPSPVA
jgi:hypothetical protein